jgi:hypothetical protein
MPNEPAAPYANSQDLARAEEASHNRAEMAHAMGQPKDVEEYLRVRAEDSRIRDEVGARSDGRAYGSGSTNDPRGHRHLHEHFARAFHQEHAYAGPESHDLREYGYDDDYGYAHGYQGTRYQDTHARYPDAVPPHPKAPSRDNGKPGGWFSGKRRTGWAD